MKGHDGVDVVVLDRQRERERGGGALRVAGYAEACLYMSVNPEIVPSWASVFIQSSSHFLCSAKAHAPPRPEACKQVVGGRTIFSNPSIRRYLKSISKATSPRHGLTFAFGRTTLARALHKGPRTLSLCSLDFVGAEPRCPLPSVFEKQKILEKNEIPKQWHTQRTVAHHKAVRSCTSEYISYTLNNPRYWGKPN